MSRIKGIEIKHKSNIQSHKNGRIEIFNQKNDNLTSSNKEDLERQQVNELLIKLPKLGQIFDVHRKIGEGTFSSVYLGSLKKHRGLAEHEKRWFALKHLVPTAHPARVEHELKCLQEMGGKNHVIGVELCLRHLDTIVFVMPYIPHNKFSEYVGDMDCNELRDYMRALITALKHVHSFGVIHRDIKPSNFLYDRENRRYLLVDFGLAQRVTPSPSVTPAHSSSTSANKRMREQDDSPTEPKRLALDLTMGVKVTLESCTPQAVPVVRNRTGQAEKSSANNSPRVGACACCGVGAVCAECAGRVPARAPRAGTQGFRPPEVLLKYPHQTCAVDMWACGVVLTSALCGRYPVLRGGEDAAALAELSALLGSTALRRAALALRRRLLLSQQRPALCLRELAAKLRPPPKQGSESREVGVYPDSAFSLATRLLDPLPSTRLTAAAALNHPFLAES